MNSEKPTVKNDRAGRIKFIQEMSDTDFLKFFSMSWKKTEHLDVAVDREYLIENAEDEGVFDEEGSLLWPCLPPLSKRYVDRKDWAQELTWSHGAQWALDAMARCGQRQKKVTREQYMYIVDAFDGDVEFTQESLGAFKTAPDLWLAERGLYLTEEANQVLLKKLESELAKWIAEDEALYSTKIASEE